MLHKVPRMTKLSSFALFTLALRVHGTVSSPPVLARAMAPSNTTSPIPQAAATAPVDVERVKATDEEGGLPGMKRGIAIGVACSVGIILIALLTFIAVRRRKRLAKKAAAEAAKAHPVAEVEGDGGFWPPAAAAPEKPQKAEMRHGGMHRGPPVEADAQTIHELDAGQIPELPDTHLTYELDGGGKGALGAGGDESAQTQRWEEWKYAPEGGEQGADRRNDEPGQTQRWEERKYGPQDHQNQSSNDSKYTLPTLTVSSPGTHTPYSAVSPLVRTPSQTPDPRSFSYDTLTYYEPSALYDTSPQYDTSTHYDSSTHYNTSPHHNTSTQHDTQYSAPAHYNPPSPYRAPTPYNVSGYYDTPSPAQSPFEESHLMQNRNNGDYDMR